MVYCGCPATLRLELLDVTGTVVDSMDLMDETNGYRVAELDLPFPAVRAVVAALPTRDGDFDTTSLLGPRVVTITGSIIASAQGSRQDAVGRLAQWCQPRIRPRLVYAVDPGEAPMAIGLRGSQLTAPYNDPFISAFTVSWVAPNPIAYALQPHALTPSVRRATSRGGHIPAPTPASTRSRAARPVWGPVPTGATTRPGPACSSTGRAPTRRCGG